MKIVYMGTPDFAVGPLEALLEGGYEVTAVVTQPDKPKGRSGQLTPPPIKECAIKHGIPVFQPVKIKKEEAISELKTYEADIFVVAAFGQILSKEILDMPKYGCINIHASLLPKYRGAAPIQWSIIDGEKETGVTIQQMDVGVDTGDILSQKIVPITMEDTGASLFDKLCLAGSELLLETLPRILAGTIQPRKQDETQSTHAKMLTKEMGKIDFTKSADSIEHLIRGLNSWPSAYTSYHGKIMKIWKAELADANEIESLHADEIDRLCVDDINKIKAAQAILQKQIPGTIVMVNKDSIDVMTGDGLLRILEIQLEGKKRMRVKDFMLGHTFEQGTGFPS